jgi:glycosyltransferase involved in cell wall biosynthesis
MLEAMLCGRPVIATDIGGIAEWIQDDCGFLIKRPEPFEIAATLESLWAHRDDLEQLGRNAHAVVSNKLDPDPAGTLIKWLDEKASPRRT